MCSPTISVVIISRNEENNITSCIESILEATKHIQNSEVILVDSASTDKTVEIATKYPITILQLNPSWQLSSAAGRYIGFLYSKGKYIQFQDGDTLLDRDWFKHSIPILEKEDLLAGVVGIITQKKYDTILAKKMAKAELTTKFGEITDYQEDALFKRDILLEVGSFNPYLKAQEEGELCERIIDRGFKLLRIHQKMSIHLGGRKEGYWDILKRKPRYAVGKGQKLRLSLNNKKILWWRIKEHKFLLIFLFLTLYGFLSIGVYVFGKNINLLYVWTIGILCLIGWIFYEEHNIKIALTHVLSITIQSPFFLYGMIRSIPDPSTYPTNVKIIKDYYQSEF